jgi:hypothetical protein
LFEQETWFIILLIILQIIPLSSWLAALRRQLGADLYQIGLEFRMIGDILHQPGIILSGWRAGAIILPSS